jgi:hypothetical protein
MNLKKRVEELEKLVKRQEEIILKQAEEIRELKEQLKSLKEGNAERFSFIKTSIKTHQKKPGQKEGHEGKTRPLPEKVDEEITLKTCPDCGTRLSTTEVRERYVEDIVFPKKVVRKYYQHRGWCSTCKQIKTATTKDALPKCRFGLVLMLFVCFQKFGLALTINKIKDELKTYFNVQITEGEISQIITKTAKHFREEFESLKQEMRKMAVSYTDETSWRENGRNRWLWTFINDKIALYAIDKSRGAKVPLKILGKDYEGIVSSDRYSAYNMFEKQSKCKQQKCWTHILRNSKDLAEHYPEAKYIHKRLKFIYKKAKAGEKKENLLHWIDLIANRKYPRSEIPKFVKSICIKHRENLFRFVDNPEVESTNNRAERGLRPLVVMRKISGGNRSKAGVQATEIFSSVINSWQLQGRNFIADGTNYLQSTAFR